MAAALMVSKQYQKSCTIFLADEHALTTQPDNHHDIIKTTTQRFQTITESVANLLHHPVHIEKASDVVQTPLYQALRQNVEASLSDQGIESIYHLLQITDALYFSKEQSIAKVSWRTKPQDPTVNYDKMMGLPKGSDESGFDSLIRYFLPESHFILTPTGKTADPKRPNVNPYASSHPESEKRIFFRDATEVIEQKIQLIRDQALEGGNTGKTARSVLSRYSNTLSILGLSDEPLDLNLSELMRSLDR